MRNITNRLDRLEAIASHAARVVVAVVASDETEEQAAARATEGLAVDESTLVVLIRRFGGMQ